MDTSNLVQLSALPADRLERQLSRRLRRIEGQVRGVQGMIADARDLSDIHAQLLAVQSATRAAIELLERERVVQQVKASIQRALIECLGHCDLCDQLEQLSVALNQLDSGVVERFVAEPALHGASAEPRTRSIPSKRR